VSGQADSEVEYPSFLTCRMDPDGKINGFHICAKRVRAVEWREHDAVQRQPGEGDAQSTSSPDPKSIEAVAALPEEPGFATTLSKFVKSMRSFYDLVTINGAVRAVLPNVFIDREFDEYRQASLPLLESTEGYVLHGVPESQVSQINQKVKRYDHLKDGIASLPASVLMGLVARYDANISGLVRFLLQNRKEHLAGAGREIPVKDVLSANSFEDLVASLIEDEIHSLMRGSHEDQVRYIEENFSIKVRDHFKRWPDFVEIFERRNLAAHGEGFANARYCKICSAAKVSPERLLSLGDPVKLSDGYLRSSIDVLVEFGTLLIWWLWLKQSPGEASAAYETINDVTYDLIVDKRYRLAARILESVLSRNTQGSPEATRRMMAVNLANCQKKTKNDSGFHSALKMFDWTASADHYRISVAALEGDIEQVCSLMPRVADEEIVGKAGFRDWPVFDWVRDDERVRHKFKEVFGEPLRMASESGGATEDRTGNDSSLSIKTDESSSSVEVAG
jgi:hypothetical protein